MPRHFFVVFLSFYAELTLAAANDWNCEKNAAGEWSCETQLSHEQPKNQLPAAVKTTPSVPQAVIKPVAPKPATKKAQPALLSEPLPVAVESQPTAVPETKPAVTPVLPTVKPTVAAVPVVKTGKAAQKLPMAVPEVRVAQNSAPIPLQPASNENTKQEGWTCAPNEEKSTWDCRLVGANPKGEAKIVAEEEHSLRLLAPAFDLKQERAFKNLQKEFPFDPWQQCSAPHQPKQKLVPKKGLRATTPLEIESDYSEVFDKEVSSFSGNVDMRRADQHLLADIASYDSVSDMMDTQGDVYYSEDGLALFSNTATLKLATDKSILRDVLFESLTGPFRGSAQVAYKDSKELSRYNEAAYTSCRPGNQDWVIHTSRLKINKDSGEGSATNAWLEFKGVPVLYTPYLSFPVDDRRKSGFLPPSWGNTSKSGFQLTTPFYWNIAPNYDVLFKPRYFQRRGALLTADMRYLTEMSKGDVGIEFMPVDKIRQTSRFFGSLKNTTTFLPNLTANADLNYASDGAFLYELGNALNVNNNGSYIRSNANLNYNLPGLSFLAQINRYQTIDSTLPHTSRPYQQLPQVNLNLNHSVESMPIDLAMNNEFVYFYRSGRVNGERFNTRPSIVFPLSNSGIFATPKLSFQYTQYLLQNQTPTLTKNLSRALPIASLDTGVFLEREFQAGESSFRHTLEPRAFYLYAPRVNQDNIPIFDSALYDFTFASLFRENRFSGIDRVQDANQLSLSLTSRLLDTKTGLEYAKLGLGQILYFKDRTVNLPGYPTETNRLSSFVTELSGNLTEHFSYLAGMQWDPYSHQFTRGSARIQFLNQQQQIVNLGYLYRQYTTVQNVITQDQIHQTDVSFRLPVFDDWYAMGRWLYSIHFNTTTDSFIGLEKDSCCWRFSIIGRRFANNLINPAVGTILGSSGTTAVSTVPPTLQTGIFVQLELKGLGSFGDQIDQFLERNIPGYHRAP
jgi:LPS-assembly protein